MLAKEIEDKAFALNAGQNTQPIRTKQGFIILQVTQHNPGGEASFKQVEPQVEEAIFLEQMQPKLREYLSKLREEAYIEIKPGAVDSGSSGNEMRLTYSAYAPPEVKKKKKFARARYRGKDRSKPAAASVKTATANTPSATATTTPAKTLQASNDTKVMKPGKPEKIRFGQAPRESLPSSQTPSTEVATASVPADATPTVTTPDTRYVNPDGTVSSATPTVVERKTRLSNRPVVHKPKKDKNAPSPDTPPSATPEELADQKVQNAPLGLADQAAQKKAKAKGDKIRLADKPKPVEETPQPYLGKPEPASSQPVAPATNPPAPTTAPTDAVPPAAPQP